MSGIEALDTARAHPIRRRILAAIMAKGEAMCPAEVGRLHEDVTVNNIAHHFKVLSEVGLLKLDRTEPRRGSVAHFYRLDKAFTPTMRESTALDRIAEILAGAGTPAGRVQEVTQLVAATGRPTGEVPDAE